MELRNPMQAVRPIFDGADSGLWTLPKPLVEARDALVRVQAIELPPHPPEHPSSVRDRMAYLIATGADIDPTPVLDAQRALDEYNETLTLQNAAREIARQALSTALHNHARALVTDHLRPAHEELVS